MKATIEPTGNQILFTLTPETEEEGRELKAVGVTLTRSHQIMFRGFKYMEPSVELLVQPHARSD